MRDLPSLRADCSPASHRGAALPGAAFARSLPPLHLTTGIAATLVLHARREAPFEACGLLIGTTGTNGGFAKRALRLPNLDKPDDPARFRLSPRAVLRSLRAARRADLDVIGVWHSHPQSAPTPSPTDLAQAWAGWSYLIVGLRDQHPEITSWRLTADGFQQEPIRLSPSSNGPPLPLPEFHSQPAPLPSISPSPIKPPEWSAT